MKGFNCKLVHPECTAEPFATGKAWKIHATRSHGGWTPKEYVEISRAATFSGREAFDQRPPETESHQPPPAGNPIPPQSEKLSRLKGKLAGGLARMIARGVEKFLDLEPLTDSDCQAIAEAFEEVGEGFGIETNFQPAEPVVLTSRVWLLIIPLFAIAGVILERLDFDKFLALFDQNENEPDRGNRGTEGER